MLEKIFFNEEVEIIGKKVDTGISGLTLIKKSIVGFGKVWLSIPLKYPMICLNRFLFSYFEELLFPKVSGGKYFTIWPIQHSMEL